MAFLEERLPPDIERGAQMGPQFSTSLFIAASGFEKRNSNWDQARRKFDVSYGVQRRRDANDPDDGFDRLLDFYHVTLGEADGFRFRDWSDYQVGDFAATTLTVSNTGFIAIGDNVTTQFKVIKRRTVGAVDYDRILKKISLDETTTDPVIRVILDTTELTRVVSAPSAGEFSVDADTALITTGDVPTDAQTLRWAGEFDTPVRFDSDMLQVQIVLFEKGSIPPIMLRELRLK